MTRVSHPRRPRRAPLPPPAEHETWPSFADDPEGATKSLLQDLIFRSEIYPELAEHLAPSIKSLELSLRKAPKSAAQRILTLIRESTGMTIDELQEDMVLPEAMIRAELEKLIEAKAIEKVTNGRRIDPRKGRVEYFYVIFGQQLGSNYSAPARESSPTKAFMDSFRD